MRRFIACCAVLLALGGTPAKAQTFQLVVAETPPGAGSRQPIQRYTVAGSGGTMTRVPDIPPNLTNDPAGLAFRTAQELWVGNRAAHSGNSSLSSFTFDPAFSTFTVGPTVTGNSLTDIAGICFNPVDGELFVTNFRSGLLSRFTFDPGGNAVPNGTITMPDNDDMLGVAVRSLDQQLFVSDYTYVRRFARGAGGTYTHIGNFAHPTARQIHFLKFRADELYVPDIVADAVFRYLFDAQGNPIPNGSFSVPDPIDTAFSPDGMEMFVASHYGGGIRRYLYDAVNDAWVLQATIGTPSLGGIATTVQYFTVHGQGCPGTGGVIPRLTGSGQANPGASITLEANQGLPNALGMMLSAIQAGSVPLPGSCIWLQQNVVGDTGIIVLDNAGTYTQPINIPPTVTPGDFFLQFFILDSGAANGLFSDTNGLRVTLW